MKKMRIFLTLAIVALMSMTMNAQGRHGHRGDMSSEQRIEKRVDCLAKDLSLTDKQRAEVEKIYRDEAQKMKAKFADGKKRKSDKEGRPDGKEMGEKMKAERDATDAKIEALLTPDQKAKFAEIKKNRPDRPRHGKPGKGGGCCGKAQACDKAAKGGCSDNPQDCDKAKKSDCGMTKDCDKAKKSDCGMTQDCDKAKKSDCCMTQDCDKAKKSDCCMTQDCDKAKKSDCCMTQDCNKAK